MTYLVGGGGSVSIDVSPAGMLPSSLVQVVPKIDGWVAGSNRSDGVLRSGQQKV